MDEPVCLKREPTVDECLNCRAEKCVEDLEGREKRESTSDIVRLNEERNKWIKYLARCGVDKEIIAASYGISSRQVRRICTATRAGQTVKSPAS